MKFSYLKKIMISLFVIFIFLSCDDTNTDNKKEVEKLYSVSISSDLSEILLKDELKFAVIKSPIWLRPKLIEKLKTLKPLPQEDYPENYDPSRVPENVTNPSYYFANYILAIDNEKIVDEVIFQIVTTPNSILTSFNFRIDLFVDNAESIYQIAEDLNYVDIIEGEDFTSLKYKIDDGTGNITNYELPYYYYYNYVLPLVIDDNSWYYIAPNNGLFHEKGDDTDEGKMWRTYIYNHNKENRPSLKELLQNQNVLWRNKSNFQGHYNTTKWNNGYPDSELTLDNQVEFVTNFLAEAYNDQGAIGSVIEWMMKNMIFGAKGKRPIEPAEIFTWGWGNCGEWGDLTTAVLRTSLIPATVISTSIDDHVWNEFFDGEWHNIEPYHPFVDYQYYDKDIASEIPDINGFGWQAHMTSRARHDGFMENVIDRYSGYGTLNLTVKDKNGLALDDSIILIYGQGDLREEGELSLGLVTYTDIFGNASINLGDNRAFWGVVFTPVGSYPIEDNEVYKILDNVEANNEYTWDIVIDGEKAIFEPKSVNNEFEDKDLELSFKLNKLVSYSSGYNIWHGAQFIKKDENLVNNLNIMILDSENYEKFKNEEEFDAIISVTDKDDYSLDLPILENDLYFVIANKNNLRTFFWSELNLSFKINNKELKTYSSEIYIRPNQYFAVSFNSKEE